LSKVIGLKYSYYQISKEQLLKLVQVLRRSFVFVALASVGIGVIILIRSIQENREFRRIINVLKEAQEEMKSQVHDEKQEQH